MAWWLLLSWALAAPVSLPESADPDAWRDVLQLVGLSIADDAGEEGVHIHPHEGRWDLVVRWNGGERRATVEVPTSLAQREDVAQLAASLVRALDAPTLPGLPELPAVPPLPTPRPVPEPRVVPVQPPPAPEPVPAPQPEAVSPPEPAVEPDPEPVVEVAPEPAVEPAPVPPAVGPSADVAEPPPSSPSRWSVSGWAGAGLGLRSTVQPAALGHGWIGVARGAWQVGAGLEATAPAGLVRLSVDRRVAEVSPSLGAWVVGWGAVGVGPVVQYSLRSFRGDGLVEQAEVPVVAGSLWGAIKGVPLRAELRVARDLRPVELFVDGVREQVFEPWGVALMVSAYGRPGGRRASGTSPR